MPWDEIKHSVRPGNGTRVVQELGCWMSVVSLAKSDG